MWDLFEIIFAKLNFENTHASVHDEIRHQCSQCTKSYSRRGYLQQHIKKQHSQTIEIQPQKLPFQNCLWCIEKLPNYDQFIIHAKDNHPKLVAGLLNLTDFQWTTKTKIEKKMCLFSTYLSILQQWTYTTISNQFTLYNSFHIQNNIIRLLWARKKMKK